MDGLNLALFIIATFFGGLTSGLSGFAMGLVVSGVWLHIMTPEQNAALIVLCGLVTQGSGIWRVRHELAWRKFMPFIVGGAFGVPAGTALLTWVDPAHIRLGIGVLLVVFSLYNLLKPQIKTVGGGIPTEVGVGVANGLIGGLTGLGGIIVSVWCQMRGGTKDSQRAIFQPVMFATFGMSAVTLTAAGAITVETLKWYALALPALAIGIWSGMRIYGKLNDAMFRKVILFLLLASGLSLTVPAVLSFLGRTLQP